MQNYMEEEEDFEEDWEEDEDW